MTKEQKKLIATIESEIDIDVAYTIENGDYDDVDILMEDLREQVYQIEVIYYHNAIKYLAENDPSLQYSCEIAHELGYTLDKINSELLATLLQQQEAQEVLWQYRDELAELFINND